MGLGPFLFWRVARIMQREFSRCFLCVHASCRLERTGRVRDVRNGVVSQSRQKSFAGAPFAVMLFCWFVGCCCFGLGEDQRSICVESPSSISSLISDFISSFSSRFLFFFLCLLCLSSFFLFFFPHLFLSLTQQKH